MSRARHLAKTKAIQQARREYKNDDPCWCGEPHPWCADTRSGLRRRCGGTGMLDCECGGDQCACHNHGEVECWGCIDCDHDLDQPDGEVDGPDGDSDFYEPEPRRGGIE